MFHIKFSKVFWVFSFLILLNLGSGCKVTRILNDVKVLKTKMDLPREIGEARLERLHDMPVLHLYGTPAQMGYQYGATLKEELASLFDILETLFSKKRIAYYYNFADSVEQYLPPCIREELKAMAEGSGINYKALIAYNILPKVDCSTLAVWGDATKNGNLIFGRNADYSIRSLNEAAGIIIVRHPENGIPSVSITYLGMIGAFTGMTASGLSYGNMLVYNGKAENIDYEGLPVQLVLRMAADKSVNAQEMVENLKLSNHMMPVNVMCADSKEAFLLEMDQKKVVVRSGKQDVVMATNFFIDSSMTTKPKVCHRYRKMQRMTADFYGEMGLEEVRAIMQKARRHGRRNIQCILFEPHKFTMHISINKIPAAKGPFHTIDVRTLMNSN